jgi:hypothetical protein
MLPFRQSIVNAFTATHTHARQCFTPSLLTTLGWKELSNMSYPGVCYETPAHHLPRAATRLFARRLLVLLARSGFTPQDHS